MRPKDENGVSLPPAHIRLPEAPRLVERALFALAEDPRACALPVKRKLTLIDAAIDHVVDAGSVPKWVHATDKDNPWNHFLVDLWRIATKAIGEAHPRQAA